MSYPANDPMDPREREVASDEMWHLCADCNAAGAEFRLKRDRYLCDECAARLHAQEIAVIQELLSAPKEPEPDPLEDNSILTSADIAELAKGAEMFVGDRVGGPKNRDIAEYEMVCSRSEYVAMARNLERFARENADLRAKLAAYEEHQSYRPLIPGNLIDRIDEHGQEWTRTERVRAAVAELVQPQTVEEITRLQEKLAAAEERIATIVEWTHQYGANLCPFGNYTDSFGDGMRAAKEQVSRIAKLGKGGA